MQTTPNPDPDLELSIIIPVYNERDNLVPLERKLEEELAKLRLSYEIIFVDDGSVDGSPHIIKSLKNASSINGDILIYEFSMLTSIKDLMQKHLLMSFVSTYQ